MQTMTKPPRRLLAAAAAVALGAAMVSTIAPASAAGPYDGKTVISQGHVDVFYVSENAGAAQVTVHDDTVSPSVQRAPEDVVFQVKPSVAERTANAFIAQIPGFAEVGDTIYTLSQTNRPGEIFSGFGHSLPSGSSVTYNLTALDGPGNFATWQAGDEGPQVFLNAQSLPTSFTSQANHEHMAWGFTEPGEYNLTIDTDVTLASGTQLESPEVTYTFFVGEELPSDPTEPTDPEPTEPTDPEPGTTLTISGLSAHYHAGGVARLTANQDPQTDESHYHWFTRAPGETDWTVVPGVGGPTYGFVVGAAHDGTEVIARLYGHDHQVIAESAPVTLAVDDHGNSPVEGPIISATVDEAAGSLVVSVDQDARDVELGTFELNDSAEKFVASGDLGGIRVTDTRSENPGWNVSGRVRSFTSADGESLTGNHLGWTPTVLSSSDGQTVEAGPRVDGVLSGGEGVGAWRTLGSAASGAGVGAAELGAGLVLEAAPTLAAGTYRGLLILTAI